MAYQHKWFKEIVAWANGKTIEVNYPWLDPDDWRKFTYHDAPPDWNLAGAKYRVLP